MEIASFLPRVANQQLLRPASVRAPLPFVPAGGSQVEITDLLPSGPPAPRVETFGNLTSSAPSMANLFATVRRLAPTEITLTITGETGTGKDVLAQAIHQASPRAAGPFVVFDCGAVPANLVESELFGHQRGAFTGAHAEHEGAFERARGGTLFLDEIGELPLDLQPRLLRALENRCIRRVGGTRDSAIDVRILAATNRDLPAQVAAKTFRQDLYFRLAAAVVNLPPLRERLGDLALLVPRLLTALGQREVRVSEAALKLLSTHAWPGNVRELKNVVACALTLVTGGVLEADHLQFVASSADAQSGYRLPPGGQTLAAIEEGAIRQTLVITRGNKAQAARLLGIASSTLYEKLKKYGL